MRRGIKEMDILLVRFADARLDGLDPDGLDLFEALLAENDQDLYQWVSGQADPPSVYGGLVEDIAKHSVFKGL